MLFPLLPVRCTPADLIVINPFPSLVVTAAVCGALLLLHVLLLFRTSPRVPAALQRHWLSWARPLVLFLSAGATLGAVGLTIWLWLQSRAVVGRCSAGASERFSAQTAAYQVGTLGVQITVTVTALLLLLGLAMVLLSRWTWRGPQRAA